MLNRPILPDNTSELKNHQTSSRKPKRQKEGEAVFSVYMYDLKN